MNNSDIKKDSKGNLYVEMENIRLTYVQRESRPSEKDWPGKDVIRIQAKRGKGDSLHRGAELPVENQKSMINVVETILLLYKSTI